MTLAPYGLDYEEEKGAKIGTWANPNHEILNKFKAQMTKTTFHHLNFILVSDFDIWISSFFYYFCNDTVMCPYSVSLPRRI
jgi:hypothetical protein